MKLPPNIEAEIDRLVEAQCKQLGFDEGQPIAVKCEDWPRIWTGTAGTWFADHLRIMARKVAEDCAQMCDDDFEQKAIRERYGLEMP